MDCHVTEALLGRPRNRLNTQFYGLAFSPWVADHREEASEPVVGGCEFSIRELRARSRRCRVEVAVSSAKAYDRSYLDAVNQAAGSPREIAYVEAHLRPSTMALAPGSTAICPFVNDRVDDAALKALAVQGMRLVAVRGADFNNVDLHAAGHAGLMIERVPAFLLWAVGEHAAALMMALNRKTHRACARVGEGNFSLDGLCGVDFGGRTGGLIGVGRIGLVVARIRAGLDCRVLAFEPVPSEELKSLHAANVSLDKLLREADINLQRTLRPETRHLIDIRTVERVKPGAMPVNTSHRAGRLECRHRGSGDGWDRPSRPRCVRRGGRPLLRGLDGAGSAGRRLRQQREWMRRHRRRHELVPPSFTGRATSCA